MRSRSSRSATRASAERSVSRDYTRPAIANKLGAVVTCIVLVGIVFLIFGQALWFDFVNYDDAAYVYLNPVVSGGLSLSGIQWAFTHVHSENWHPLTTISHMLDCQLYGLQPWGHHLTSVILHAATAVFLFLALCQLTREQWPSAFVAVIFAIHPLHVSSVAWVAERKDVLSGLFFMLTLWAYGRYAWSRPNSIRAYLVAIVFFALGLMCKPTLVTLPFVLLLLDYWPLRRIKSNSSSTLSSARSFGSIVVEKIPFFTLSAASCVATLLAQKSAVAGNVQLPLAGRIGNAIFSYAVYIGQTLWPARLGAVYPFPASGIGLNLVIGSVAILVAISVTVFLWHRSAPYLLTGWLWFVGVLIPMIGIIQVGNQARADRYTYLAQIGLCILVTWGVAELLRKWRHGQKAMIALVLVIVPALAVASSYQTAIWRNSEALWRHTLAVTENNYIAYNNLGGALRQSGRLDDAIIQYRKALETCPSCPYVYNSLGYTYADKGEWREAIKWYQRAIKSWPAPDAHNNNNMAIALAQLGQKEEALAQFREAIRIDPSFVDARYNLALMLKDLGQSDEARTQLEEVLRLEPKRKQAETELRLLEGKRE